jgi:ribosomal protein S18 acetylase RimI-like enzyme
MQIRALEATYRDPLERFLRRIPTGDRTFFKEPIEDPAVIASWVAGSENRWVAIEDESVIGYVAVIALHGLSDHVAEIRLIVDPGRRGEGLGRTLAQHAILAALEMGFSKLVVEVLADEGYTVEMFRSLGFDPEALLVGQVRGDHRQLLDLMILAHHASDGWAAAAASGIAEAL